MVLRKLSAHKNNRTKKLLVFGVVILVVAASTIAFYKNKRDNHTSVTETISVDTPPKRDGGTDGSDKTPPQYEGSSVAESPSIDGVINFKSVANDILTIRVTINQSITTGTCSLTLSRSADEKQVLRTAEIMPNPSSATCKGFDIPVSELGSGIWNIVIEITDGARTGKINGDVTL